MLKNKTNSTLFLLFATICSFLIAMEYGIARPTSNAIFISHFTSKWIPYAWLFVVPLNFATVSIYSKLLPRLGAMKMFVIISLITINCSLLCAMFATTTPFVSFIHYIWKDVYILLMFKQLWSLIHSAIDTKKTRYTYGLLFGFGSLGSICGSLLPGYGAVQMGSQTLFYATAPIYLLLMLSFLLALKQTPKIEFTNAAASSLEGFTMVKKSPYLICLLGVVVFMQMSIGLTDLQFNCLLEKNIFSLDERTQYCGRIIGIVNLFSVAFQLIGGFLVIRLLGAKRTHLFIPFFLGINTFLFILFPTFGMISYGLIAIKSMDFALFGIAREMLYSPLSVDEKYRAKAVIDVFGYRTAKALASFILFALSMTLIPILHLASIALLATFLFWICTVFMLFKQEKARLLV